MTDQTNAALAPATSAPADDLAVPAFLARPKPTKEERAALAAKVAKAHNRELKMPKERKIKNPPKRASEAAQGLGASPSQLKSHGAKPACKAPAAKPSRKPALTIADTLPLLKLTDTERTALKSADKAEAAAKLDRTAAAIALDKKAAKLAAKIKAQREAIAAEAEGTNKGKTKTQIAADLIRRKGGCTVAEVLAATGWTKVGMPGIARSAGIKLVKQQKDGEPTRYCAG